MYRKHIKNSLISKIKTTELRKEHLQKYFNFKQSELKVGSIRTLKTFISTILNFAETEDIINKNYCRGVKLKKEITKEKNKLLTDKEIDNLLESLKKEKQLLMIVKIALATGMRIGEILALIENDIDFKNSSINVNKTVAVYKDFYTKKGKFTTKITPPKTKNSIRVCYFPSSLLKDLKDYIKIIKIKYLKNGIKYNKNSLLFFNSKFKPSQTPTFSRKLNMYYKKCNINHTGFHVLRHTHVSKLYKQGISQKIIQQQVGHTNTSMTMYYTHIENNEQK